MIAPGKLLITGKPAGKGTALYAYDLKSAKPTKLARIPITADTTLFPDGFTTGDGRIAWWTARGPNDHRTADIWTVPTTGGTPRRVTSTPLPPSTHITGVAITPDGFAWSSGKEGVYTVGTSGKPQHLNGTEGQHILSWPWIGSPGISLHLDVPFQTIMNVKTGERRGRPENVLACGVSLCVTRGKDSATAQVQDRNGRRLHPAMDIDYLRPRPLQLDRFVSNQVPDYALIHDLRSGISAKISYIESRLQYHPPVGSNIAVFTRDGHHVVVDLTAIR